MSLYIYIFIVALCNNAIIMTVVIIVEHCVCYRKKVRSPACVLLLLLNVFERLQCRVKLNSNDFGKQSVTAATRRSHEALRLHASLWLFNNNNLNTCVATYFFISCTYNTFYWRYVIRILLSEKTNNRFRSVCSTIW